MVQQVVHKAPPACCHRLSAPEPNSSLKTSQVRLQTLTWTRSTESGDHLGDCCQRSRHWLLLDWLESLCIAAKQQINVTSPGHLARHLALFWLIPAAAGAGGLRSSPSGGTGSLWGGARGDLWSHSQQKNHRSEEIQMRPLKIQRLQMQYKTSYSRFIVKRQAFFQFICCPPEDNCSLASKPPPLHISSGVDLNSQIRG